MMTPDALAALIRVADDEGIRFISDEIYHGLDYAVPAETAARLSENAVVINSFSKYFCMTGWRIGWMVVPQALVRPIDRLQGNLAISVPTLSQIAAEAAFEGRAELEAIKHGYEDNRKILIEGLPKAGLTKFLPVDGAFYLYADVSEFSNDSFDFAKRLLRGGACGGDAGRRFRSGQRPAFRPLLLRRLGRRHEGSGRAHRRLVAQALTWLERAPFDRVLRRGYGSSGDRSVLVPWWSITKTCLAACVLVLVAGGRLDLDRPHAGPPLHAAATAAAHQRIELLHRASRLRPGARSPRGSVDR